MKKLYRVIDANINRASEGLRVLEDTARFYFDDSVISKQLRIIRHNIRDSIMGLMPRLLNGRDSVNDVGVSTSKNLRIDNKACMKELVAANFKRLQEALRTIEENLKVLGYYELSKKYEEYRFSSYSVEKDFSCLYSGYIKRDMLNTGLYCLTSQEHSRGRDNIEVVKEMISAGVKIIQYREKEKKILEKYNECLKLRELTEKAGVTLIINDDIDIAMLVKADGVHIGQDDLPIEKVRELVGNDMIIGLSTHSPEQADDAVKRGADYIGVGPIYKTYTKKDVCEPVGLEYLSYVVKNVKIPFVAIGGIKEHNMQEVLEQGARCIAMVTEIVGAEDIKEKIDIIKDKMKRGVQ